MELGLRLIRGTLAGTQSGLQTRIATTESVSGCERMRTLAAILAQRKERTKLGLSKYAAEAAEQAAMHRDKLGIAGKVKDLAGVHKTLWPNQSAREEILQIGFIIGTTPIYDAETGEVVTGPRNS